MVWKIRVNSSILTVFVSLWYITDRFHSHAIKKLNRKSKEIVMLLKINQYDTSPSLRSVRFSKLQMFVEMFRRNLQSPVWKVWKRHVGAHLWCTKLVHQFRPIWRPENSIIWNLLWLSRRLITCIEQTGIYISTFPNALTSKKGSKSWEKLDRSLVSRTAI